MRPHQGVHVKGELDSEDLIEKVSGGRRCPRIDSRADCEPRLYHRYQERQHGRRSERRKMKFYRRCDKFESLGEGLRTAVLRAVACGGHAAHRTIGTHTSHHWASRDTGCGRALNAGQSGQRGLNRQESGQQDCRELDAPFHLLILKIVGGFLAVCVLDHIERKTFITAAGLQSR